MTEQVTQPPRKPPGVREENKSYLSQCCALRTTKAGSSQICMVKREDTYKLLKEIFCLLKGKIMYSATNETQAQRRGPISLLDGFKNSTG